jgi:hypothetical protein
MWQASADEMLEAQCFHGYQNHNNQFTTGEYLSIPNCKLMLSHRKNVRK